jgi:tetratricopeptide (TPR) repeat protein
MRHLVVIAILAPIPASLCHAEAPEAAVGPVASIAQLRVEVAAAWKEHVSGHWPDAISKARRILARLAPDDPASHALRGDLLRLLAEEHQTDQSAAVAAYDDALSVGPRSADLLAGKGQSLHQLDRAAEAIACFDESLSLRPDHADILRLRGLAFMALHENDKAMADLARAAQRDPCNPRPRIALAAMQRRMGDVSAAEASLEEAVAIAAAQGDDLRRGEALAALRRTTAALEALDAAVTQDPLNLEAIALRSATYADAHDAKASLADAREIARRDPDNAGHWLRIGDILGNKMHDTDAALEAFDRGLRMAPKDVELLVARGRLSFSQNRYDDATVDFCLAAEVNPHALGIHAARAAMSMRRRDFHQAVAVYDRLLAIVPRDPLTLRNRSAARRDLGDEQGALADCDAALALLPPGNQSVRGSIEREAKRWPESILAYSAAIAADPGNARLLHDRAWVYNEIEQFKKAADDCRAGLALDPDDDDLREELAFACKGLGDHDAAIAQFTKLLERNSQGDPGLYRYRGESLMAKQDHAAARADFERARDLEPLNPHHWDWLGASHREADEFDAALDCFDRAAALDPGRAHFHRNRGDVLRRMQRYGEAVAAYGRAIQIDPTRADDFYWRGICRKNLHDLLGAEADLTTAAALDPNDFAIADALERVRIAVARLRVAAIGDRTDVIRGVGLMEATHGPADGTPNQNLATRFAALPRLPG